MSETTKQRINKDEIVAKAKWLVENPLVRNYNDDERKVISETETSTDPYRRFCSYIVRSWIDGSRYIEAIQTADTDQTEHLTQMVSANIQSRDNYIAYHAAIGQYASEAIDVAQAVQDARQVFVAVGDVQESRYA